MKKNKWIWAILIIALIFIIMQYKKQICYPSGTCTNQCTNVGETWCASSVSVQTCGDVDGDGYTEYYFIPCTGGALCVGGKCISQTCSQAGGICYTNPCHTYSNCNELLGTCGGNFCCSGSCSQAQQTCSDGTAYNSCSVYSSKPKYCDNGVLVDKCHTCGCPTGQMCQSDGTCGGTTLITYSNFLNYKTTFLGGGVFPTFITNSNQWVVS